MAAKLIVLVAALAVCQAVPVWIGNDYYPGMIMRIGRSPNVAFGFGSGFSSNIGGIAHSTGIGSSFQSGDAEAYGAGVGAANGGSAYGQGVGIAKAAPSYPISYQPAPAFGHNSYGSAVSSAQNFGGNYGSAISAAQTQNGLQYGSAISNAQNHRGYESATSAANSNGLGYGSAVSSAQNAAGGHYGSAVSSAHNAGNNYGSAISSAQTHNGRSNYGAAVSSAQNINGYKASTAQTIQQRGGALQSSGASSINAPGIQAAQSHAVNTGYY